MLGSLTSCVSLKLLERLFWILPETPERARPAPRCSGPGLAMVAPAVDRNVIEQS
jgi:hypothetical protein